MRIEYIQCDICEKKHNAEYRLPVEWITTSQYDRYGVDEEHHFCSKACLIAWASEKEENHVTTISTASTRADD